MDSSSKYRYGFNDKEKDDAIEGAGNDYDYGDRMYDARLGRFLSVDPMTDEFAWWTPYQFAGNSPIWAKDLDGDESDEGTDPNCVAPTVQTTSLGGGGSLTTEITPGGVTIDPGSPNFVTAPSVDNYTFADDPIADWVHKNITWNPSWPDESNPDTQPGGNNVVGGPPSHTQPFINTKASNEGTQIEIDIFDPTAVFDPIDPVEPVNKAKEILNSTKDFAFATVDLIKKIEDKSTEGKGQPVKQSTTKDQPMTGAAQVKKAPVLTKATAKIVINTLNNKSPHPKTKKTNYTLSTMLSPSPQDSIDVWRHDGDSANGTMNMRRIINPKRAKKS
jgi:RHS repeat-associated protein